ncbi:hypothetical protein ABMA57_00965 [Saccharospirillum sp. HFRX-1]|uniref:hypothetical protein n=1 Tax=unclassified Saccharospirillum TaxID=2633430 RepID=UPI00371D66A2
MKPDIIENLQFLISSAQQRNLEQGIQTFNYYIEELTRTNYGPQVCEYLYNELSSMQRFAEFNDREWQAVLAIFKAIESCR